MNIKTLNHAWNHSNRSAWSVYCLCLQPSRDKRKTTSVFF